MVGCASIKCPHPFIGNSVVSKENNNSVILEKSSAHDRAMYAAEAAVGKPGIYVCRSIKFGISEQDWIRGTVVDINRDKIKVNIDDPGRFTHLLNGVELTKGVLLWDDDIAWLPCVK